MENAAKSGKTGRLQDPSSVESKQNSPDLALVVSFCASAQPRAPFTVLFQCANQDVMSDLVDVRDQMFSAMRDAMRSRTMRTRQELRGVK